MVSIQVSLFPVCHLIWIDRIEIYRGENTDWTLETVDASNNSTVWDDLFATDQAALDEALRTVREEGIESLVGPPSTGPQ